MTDERFDVVLSSFYRATSTPPPAPAQGVGEVMAQVQATRQRGRWWPLPVAVKHVPVPATGGRQPTRGFTMFSARGIVAASVIVALFSGLLVTGVLTPRQDDTALPAAPAPTGSPTPDSTVAVDATARPDPTPLGVAAPDSVSKLGLAAEEVEPGVLLLRPEAGGKANKAVDLLPDIVGLDGSLWRYREQEDERASVLTRLGEQERVPWKRNWAPFDGTGGNSDIDVAPDGTIWLTLQKGVASYDGTGWTVHHRIPQAELLGLPAGRGEADFADEDGSLIVDLEISPDGSVWVAHLDAGADEVEISRFDGDRWQPMGTFEAHAGTYEDLRVFIGLAADGDDGVWLATSDPLVLRRYQDGGWEEVGLPADLDPILDDGRVVSNILGLRAGLEGTLWLHTRRPGGLGRLGLDYYDGSTWSGWQSEGEWPDRDSASAPDFFRGIDALGPDGGAWIRVSKAWEPCAGVARYVGTTRTHHFLADRCVHAVRITPDGDVWLTAGKKDNEGSATTKLFLIPSEVVAVRG